MNGQNKDLFEVTGIFNLRIVSYPFDVTVEFSQTFVILPIFFLEINRIHNRTFASLIGTLDIELYVELS